MTNTYYDVIATIDGDDEQLFGSFVRSQCKEEIEAEKASWKDQGYKKIRIVSRETTEAPCPTVYNDEHQTLIVTKKELFMKQAPSFNFELDQDEPLEHALDVGYVRTINGVDDQYLVNPSYGEDESCNHEDTNEA